jgi:hypothetical protein
MCSSLVAITKCPMHSLFSCSCSLATHTVCSWRSGPFYCEFRISLRYFVLHTQTYINMKEILSLSTNIREVTGYDMCISVCISTYISIHVYIIHVYTVYVYTKIRIYVIGLRNVIVYFSTNIFFCWYLTAPVSSTWFHN